MRTRTYLTTPPGQEPTEAFGRAGSSVDDLPPGSEHERYVPALPLPREPRVPGRHRRRLLVIGSVLAVALVVAGLMQAGAAQRAEDPALSDPAGAPTDPGENSGIPALGGD